MRRESPQTRQARIERLSDGAAKRSADTEARARRAIIRLDQQNKLVTFGSVAAAGVSKSYLYAHTDLSTAIGNHRSSVVVLLAPPDTAPYLVVKQDENGATFLVTAAEAPGIVTVASTHVKPRRISAWTHPMADDIPTIAEHVVQPPEQFRREPAF